MGRTRQTFHGVETHQRRRSRSRHRRYIEEAVAEIDAHALGEPLEGRPVIARAADIAVTKAETADHDVVAAFAVELIVLVAADVYIVADHRVVAERVEVVARCTVRSALLDPVVAFVTHVLLVGLAAQDEVVALATNGFGGVLTGNDEVVAEPANDQVDAVASVQHVITVATLEVIIAASVGNDVVAGATAQLVVAVTAFDAIVAAIAPDSVVAFTGDEDVCVVGTAQHDVLVTCVLDVVGVRPRGQRVVAEHHLLAIRAERIGGGQAFVELPARVHFQVESRGREHQARQVSGRSVGHDQLGKRVAFKFGIHRQARGTLQVVEAIAILQFFQLVLEHEVEGRAEHAAERSFLFGQAADPQVDGIDARDRDISQVIGSARDIIPAGQRHVGKVTGAVEEVQAISRRPRTTKHQQHRRSAFALQRGHPGDRVMRAIGGDEVDQRLRMLEVLHQVDPTVVRLELGVTGLAVDIAADRVE
ncbi:hypothetical protein BSF40_50230 [Pseudomonas sp. ACN5]|nr:hypothetical protein BSF40_50230 [Pseudomonas sp. ACN5]